MSRFGIPAALAAVFIVIPHPASDSTVQGCAVAPPRGQHVDIAQESAIIIWDSGTKTEHFIRRASFKTEAKDFGFLVPTPTKPTLAEADDSAFDELKRITAPPIRATAQSTPGCGIGCSAQRAIVPGARVDVLYKQRVAGCDAAVLAANDAAALNKWLGEQGYQSSDILKEWLEPYMTKEWIITAFKIASPDAKGSNVKDASIRDKLPTAGIATKAVRMTFTTDPSIRIASRKISEALMGARRRAYCTSTPSAPSESTE